MTDFNIIESCQCTGDFADYLTVMLSACGNHSNLPDSFPTYERQFSIYITILDIALWASLFELCRVTFQGQAFVDIVCPPRYIISEKIIWLRPSQQWETEHLVENKITCIQLNLIACIAYQMPSHCIPIELLPSPCWVFTEPIIFMWTNGSLVVINWP